MRLVVPRGERLLDFSWGHGQLVVAWRGLARVESREAVQLLPAGSVAWLPPGACPVVRARSRLEVSILYLEGPVFGVHPSIRRPTELATALLRRLGQNRVEHGGRTTRALAVLVDELEASPVDGLPLPLPVDPAAREVALALIADPAAQQSLQEVCEGAGLSLRTAERRFARAGLPLGTWRRHARLQHAATLVAAGVRVGEVAAAVGYSSSSAFVAAFRAAWGVSPGAWRRSALTPRRWRG